MSNSNNKKDWETLLTDESEVEEGVEYIRPNIETKLPSQKRNECREIIKEIKNYGVNQRQILYLIYLLSLEIEDRPTMLALTKIIGEKRENIAISKLIYDPSKLED